MTGPGGQSAESEHPEPVVLAQYQSEIAATFDLNTLREAGIRCELVGAESAGFRAESPGYVRLMVPAQDADRARAILEASAEEAGG